MLTPDNNGATLLRQYVTTIIQSTYVVPVLRGEISTDNQAAIAQLPGLIREVTMPSTPDGSAVINTVSVHTRQVYPSDPLGTKPLTFHP